MSTTLKGEIIKGLGHASKRRFPPCKGVFEKRGIDFPPFVLGTVNIMLETPFEPHKTDCISLNVPQQEIDGYDAGYNEWWSLILVSYINGADSRGYIYRTSRNYHGNQVVELIAENLGENANVGKKIVLELPHLPPNAFDPLREE